MTLEKNLKFLTASMDKDLQMIESKQQKTHLIIYFNKDNLAFKCLPYNFRVGKLDRETKKMLM